MKESFGEDFLKKKYDLHTSSEVTEQAERTEHKTGEKVPQDSRSRISNYLKRFEEILERPSEDDLSAHEKGIPTKERGIEALKRILYRNHVIQATDIPEAYFKNQRRLAREQGHGEIELTQEMKAQLTEVVIADQKSSLDTWVDYLSGPDATYPTWLKYWATRSVLSMGEYDKEKKKFTKRSKGTVKPFPDLNREALAYTLDAIEKKYPNQTGVLADHEEAHNEEDAELQKLLQGENFSKLYGHAIEKVTPASVEQLESVEGEWVTYEKGTDHMPLFKSLQGHGTGWCTAGESTAKSQLQNGDFHVFYSQDSQGDASIPRVAIRMQGDSIAEVRGIAEEQNLDPYITETVKDKLGEFSDGAEYEKKASDMKILTKLDAKNTKGEALGKDELRFLYELDAPIDGFGYDRDPRIAELQNGRNIRKDIAVCTDYAEDEISLTEEEALSGHIRFHHGNLNLRSFTSAEGLTLPESMGGDLDLRSLTSAEGLTLPASVGGDLNLSGLTSAEGLTLPESVKGNLYLNRLISAKDLTLPASLGGDLNLSSLTSAEGLTLPTSVEGDLYLNRLTSAKDLTLPETEGGSLFLTNLTSAEGLTLPESMGGYLYLTNLTSAEGLTLPESVGGSLTLDSLTSTEGLTLPASVGGSLYLNSLPSHERDALQSRYPNIRITTG